VRYHFDPGFVAVHVFRVRALGTAGTSFTVWLTIGFIRVLSRKGDIGCNFPLHFYVFSFISIELGEKKMWPSFPWGLNGCDTHFGYRLLHVSRSTEDLA
jgi:hypothetical protein